MAQMPAHILLCFGPFAHLQYFFLGLACTAGKHCLTRLGSTERVVVDLGLSLCFCL